jgi:hypothetical protein
MVTHHFARVSPIVPDDIDAPVVYPLSSSSLNVTWTAPSVPNGLIISYALFLLRNDAAPVIFEAELDLHVVVDSLLPFTTYTVVIQVYPSVMFLNYLVIIIFLSRSSSAPSFPLCSLRTSL